MLLILTNSRDATADYMGERLTRDGVRFLRFDTDCSLRVARLRYDSAGPILNVFGEWYDPSAITNVWYRRPERLVPPGFDDSAEAKFIANEWSEALEGFFAHIPRPRWMNHPVAEATASQKIEQLTRARATGFQIPDTLVTQDPEELRDFFGRHGGRLITKPLSGGHVDRGGAGQDTIIFTNRVRHKHLESCDDLCACPTLFQEEILKRTDIRITVVDDAVHAVGLTASDDDGRQRCDIRRNHMEDVEHVEITLPAEICVRVRSLVAGYGLRFGAIDMAIADDGRWVFFEINPNGQWAWTDLKGATDIASSFVASFSRPAPSA